MKKATKDWTSIAVRDDTHTRLTDLKTIKEPGKMENYDDVIRRGMNMPPIEEMEETQE